MCMTPGRVSSWSWTGARNASLREQSVVIGSGERERENVSGVGEYFPEDLGKPSFKKIKKNSIIGLTPPLPPPFLAKIMENFEKN